MKIPYSDTYLFMTLLLLEEKLKKKRINNKIKKILAEFTKQFNLSKKPNLAQLNSNAAKYHGIPVKALVESQKYPQLFNAYRENLIRQIYKRITQELDFSGAEAWALIAAGLGFLNHFISDTTFKAKKSYKK
ncbi:MAG: hypothetical protein LiPW41_742 [Parcubacteria group bacterium LiPW_41]|nr:MAG: hypothetical protein LiPW41_742 [Parcubacteria group bacterium LiPW_41]